MKKLLSIILAVIMIASVMPMAFAADYELGFGEKLTLSLKPEYGAVIRFVAPKTAGYVFRSESDGVDTAVYVVDGDGNEVIGNMYDDTLGSMDFRFEAVLEEGAVCYLNVYTYSAETETFDVIAECGHEFEESKCVYCDKICDHTETVGYGVCLCGEVFLGTDIKDGDEYEYTDVSYSASIWFRFIPEESGAYSLKSFSEDSDPDCMLYDSSFEFLSSSTDVIGMDFDLAYNFVEGETYYFEVYNCFDHGGDFKITFNKAVHISDSGEEHALLFVEETYSDCINHGYSAGFYCSTCEEFTEGHEEYELEKNYHIDDDWDDICDLCGATIEYDAECECICHSEEPFLMIIWKIANFIHSVFGISPECECGYWHY